MDIDEKKDNHVTQQIKLDYENLMNGYNTFPFLSPQPLFSNGKYIQLSAYEEKSLGAAVTIGNSSIIMK